LAEPKGCKINPVHDEEIMNNPSPTKIAIQEDMLPGPSLEDRFHQAADLGLQGIEFWSETLPGQVGEIARLNGTAGVTAASINNGHRSRFLDPQPEERLRALEELKEAMTLAGRVSASGVVFVPHFSAPLLPDLSPWMDVISVERNLLAAQLVELADHAMKAGVQLWVESVNRYETHLLNQIADSASLIAPLSHPNLGIVADLFHMAIEEEDISAAILEQAQFIGHVHLADSNRRLPGLGTTDFKQVLGTLSKINYNGWLVLECDQPGENRVNSYWYMEHLPASLSLIRQGFL
jgi:sugar phosphate isomerase/epimerase